MLNLLWIAVSLPVGIAIGYYLRKGLAKKLTGSIEEKAEKLLAETKNKQRELLLQAKDKAIQIIDEAKKEEEGRRQDLLSAQKRLEKRESLFDQKLLELQEKQQKLYDKANQVEKVKAEIQKIKDDHLAKLEEISGLTKEEAKKFLLDRTEKTIKEELVVRISKLERESSDVLDVKAKELLSLAIERCASSHATEITTTTITIPSDEMKGRIIGREGRNIKTIEQLTGTEIIIDDTPEAITVSGFSPIRRHVAKKALEKLILDGRIHPGRIEEAVEQAKKELAMDIKKAGEDAVYELGVAGFDPKLVQILGRLKYRTSFGQNALQHSLEVAHLSALLAEELGANVSVAKKAGLLHDIGKAVDHEVTGTHPEIGRDIAKKFNIPEEIIIPIATHHDDMPPTLEAIIVKVADAISGARPGARKDTYEHYLQRLEDLEKVARSFDGVEKTYAIQAGREIRVFVTPDKIDDLGALKLAQEIAKKIEEELKYPGEIKVNVIREKRVVEYAR
ncbi:ribonuclease Y [Candidatus Falkowbacteria bacterium RIFOXYB2_FULL_38_15]|uniref:Ribonuclease Y n=1 Tax=Candidatus Falkowbacteria bacterium RIFOXYA2_FULL_38_12 TaxID=1797993 RepID=A0A1F5S303_9BACT|nr:MAG: ribonuclease Y [Candidatus Falkowbacteria bacterium RIFOXYA2_FULL_38_12]OGF32594.1 MAG: ribonuclease Y [Candidatus Falkowbacteria bacterium RIFOXYB2_FULL_38_15]OGF42116.1 MAG: ribonuclease Y [Candidatus Falkowbacteria bacterium RIFOXYD2_FULL_39_16]